MNADTMPSHKCWSCGESVRLESFDAIGLGLRAIHEKRGFPCRSWRWSVWRYAQFVAVGVAAGAVVGGALALLAGLDWRWLAGIFAIGYVPPMLGLARIQESFETSAADAQRLVAQGAQP